jgi:erythromycin esterase
VVEWLRRRAMPFDTTEPEGDYSDLASLKQLVGNARIVALGEATHGTHEFFTMKHRILRYLVEQMGFSLFAIEDSWAEGLQVDKYVQMGTGDGSAGAAVKNLYAFPWQTEEMVEMVEWMHAHNQNPGSAPPLSFNGYDMQSPFSSIAVVTAYLEKVDPASAEKAGALFGCFGQYKSSVSDYTQQPAEAKVECRKKLQEVADSLKSNQVAYEGKSSPQEFAQALHGTRIVLQAEERFASADYTSQRSALRDAAMAENVAWLLEQAGPNSKIVLWAHNAHIGTVQEGAYKSMGQYLREKYEEQMVTFGFDFYAGSFNAFTISGNSLGKMGVQTVGQAPEGSYEHGLRQTNLPRLFLDMRGLTPGTPGPEWLLGPRLFGGSISGAYDPSQRQAYYYDTSLPTTFDVLIYLQDTTPSRLLTFGR